MPTCCDGAGSTTGARHTVRLSILSLLRKRRCLMCHCHSDPRLGLRARFDRRIARVVYPQRPFGPRAGICPRQPAACHRGEMMVRSSFGRWGRASRRCSLMIPKAQVRCVALPPGSGNPALACLHRLPPGLMDLCWHRHLW